MIMPHHIGRTTQCTGCLLTYSVRGIVNHYKHCRGVSPDEALTDEEDEEPPDYLTAYNENNIPEDDEMSTPDQPVASHNGKDDELSTVSSVPVLRMPRPHDYRAFAGRTGGESDSDDPSEDDYSQTSEKGVQLSPKRTGAQIPPTESTGLVPLILPNGEHPSGNWSPGDFDQQIDTNSENNPVKSTNIQYSLLTP
jgi:hypothetical protein